MSVTVPEALPGRSRVSTINGAGAPRGDALLVAALTLGALALRLTQLRQSLFGDEIWAYQEVVGHGFRLMVHDVRTGIESSPPLFFALAWLSVKLGDPTVLLRLPTLVLGTALIPLTYLVGLRTVGRWPSLIGAAFLAIGPFSLFYGVEGRPYATMAFFVVLAAYSMLRALDSGRAWWWALYGLAEAAAAYTHYTAVFAIAVLGVWSLWAARGRLRAPVLTHLGALVLYLPWLPFVHGTLLAAYALLEPFNAANIGSDLVKVIAGHPYVPPGTLPTWPGVAVVLGLIGVGAVIGGVRGARALRRSGARARLAGWATSRRALLLALALATPVGLLLYSALATDLWNARNLYASAPFAYLGFGGLLLALPRRLGAAAAAIVLVVLMLGTARSLQPPYVRPAYRQIAAYLDRVAAPHSPLVYYMVLSAPDLAIEYHRPHTIWNGARSWRAVAPGETVYLVVEDSFAPDLHVPTFRPPNFPLTSRRHFGGLIPITVYGYHRPAGT